MTGRERDGEKRDEGGEEERGFGSVHKLGKQWGVGERKEWRREMENGKGSVQNSIQSLVNCPDDLLLLEAKIVYTYTPTNNL